jgi:hypothetical protein
VHDPHAVLDERGSRRELHHGLRDQPRGSASSTVRSFLELGGAGRGTMTRPFPPRSVDRFDD